jgi:hypothetical protein
MVLVETNHDRMAHEIGKKIPMRPGDQSDGFAQMVGPCWAYFYRKMMIIYRIWGAMARFSDMFSQSQMV